MEQEALKDLYTHELRDLYSAVLRRHLSFGVSDAFDWCTRRLDIRARLRRRMATFLRRLTKRDGLTKPLERVMKF